MTTITASVNRSQPQARVLESLAPLALALLLAISIVCAVRTASGILTPSAQSSPTTPFGGSVAVRVPVGSIATVNSRPHPGWRLERIPCAAPASETTTCYGAAPAPAVAAGRRSTGRF
jgi:hypothetical protein